MKDIASRIILSYTTLRDGDQTYGIVFSNYEKLEIAKLLDEIGILDIEVGFPVQLGYERVYLEELVRLKSKTG